MRKSDGMNEETEFVRGIKKIYWWNDPKNKQVTVLYYTKAFLFRAPSATRPFLPPWVTNITYTEFELYNTQDDHAYARFYLYYMCSTFFALISYIKCSSSLQKANKPPNNTIRCSDVQEKAEQHIYII